MQQANTSELLNPSKPENGHGPPSLKESIAQARTIAQPHYESEKRSSAYPYAVASIFLSKPLARTRISPNSITLTWIALGVLGASLLACAAQSARVLGCIALQICLLLDFVDGEVARLARTTSQFGAFLDSIGHSLINPILFLAIGYHVYSQHGTEIYLLLALSGCVSMTTALMVPYFAHSAGLTRPASQSPLIATVRSSTLLRQASSFGFRLMEAGILNAAILITTISHLENALLVFYGLAAPLWLFTRVFRYSAR